MFVDPITRQIFEHANQFPYENNPQNVIALDPDINQNYVTTPKHFKIDPSQFFEPSQVQKLIALTRLLLKMQVFIFKKDSKTFGIVFSPPTF